MYRAPSLIKILLHNKASVWEWYPGDTCKYKGKTARYIYIYWKHIDKLYAFFKKYAD